MTSVASVECTIALEGLEHQDWENRCWMIANMYEKVSSSWSMYAFDNAADAIYASGCVEHQSGGYAYIQRVPNELVAQQGTFIDIDCVIFSFALSKSFLTTEWHKCCIQLDCRNWTKGDRRYAFDTTPSKHHPAFDSVCVCLSIPEENIVKYVRSSSWVQQQQQAVSWVFYTPTSWFILLFFFVLNILFAKSISLRKRA